MIYLTIMNDKNLGQLHYTTPLYNPLYMYQYDRKLVLEGFIISSLSKSSTIENVIDNGFYDVPQ
jgi:hypothetical protein